MSFINQLQQIAKDRGGKCLSDTCKDANSILWLECEKGHRWEAAAGKVRLPGNWCPICARSTRRKTTEDMHLIAADRGGKFLSDTYKGANVKHLWECSKGHKWEATPSAIKHGSWCPTCAGNAKPTIEDMQNVANERGGKCLSDTYVNSQTKLQWECGEGHQWEATPNKVKSGRWCPECYNKTRSKFLRLSIDEMDQIATERGGRCLSTAYTNNRTKLLWECSEGHQWEAVPADVKKGAWCPVCFQIRNSNRPKREQVTA